MSWCLPQFGSSNTSAMSLGLRFVIISPANPRSGLNSEGFSGRTLWRNMEATCRNFASPGRHMRQNICSASTTWFNTFNVRASTCSRSRLADSSVMIRNSVVIRWCSCASWEVRSSTLCSNSSVSRRVSSNKRAFSTAIAAWLLIVRTNSNSSVE